MIESLALLVPMVQTLPEVSLPGNADSEDILGVVKALVVFGGRLAVLALGLITAVSVGWQLIQGFQSARAENDWGQFSIVVLTGALVLLMAVGAGQLGWSYLDSIEGLE